MTNKAEVIKCLERIMELTSTHGTSIHPSGEKATSEDQLPYVESKIRFNAIQAINLFDANHIESQPKPKRTKIEYVNVNVTDTDFFELKDEFQGREIFFNQSVTSKPDYVTAMDIKELAHHFLHKNLYRRIETPIEWWEDAADYLSKYDAVSLAKENGGYVSLDIAGNKVSMTRDQWCDFARILLEQGE